MLRQEIIERLSSLQDEKYRSFQMKLIPTVSEENVIGVRTPALRKYAKELAGREDIDDFLLILNDITGLRFSLPTKQEWLYAALGGMRAIKKRKTINDLERVIKYQSFFYCRFRNRIYIRIFIIIGPVIQLKLPLIVIIKEFFKKGKTFLTCHYTRRNLRIRLKP